MNRMPSPSEKPASYLFRVEVTVQAPNDDIAREQLIHALQAGRFADYRILSGVRLERETGTPPERPAQPATAAQAQRQPARRTAAAQPPSGPVRSGAAAPVLPHPADAKAEPAQQPPVPQTPPMPQAPQQANPAAASSSGGELEARIRAYIDSNQLLRLHINKGRGVKLDFPCRLLHLDPETRNLTVYHVDEKKVYIIRLNEVDDIIE